jgi:hypothetical protein
VAGLSRQLVASGHQSCAWTSSKGAPSEAHAGGRHPAALRLVLMLPFPILSPFGLDLIFRENMVLYMLFVSLARRTQTEPRPAIA